MTKDQLLERLKLVSIRGRMAFGTRCLEIALARYGYEEPVLRILLKRLYEFVESEQKLNSWDRRITDVAPMSILDEHPDNYLDEYETITEEQALALKGVYQSMAHEVIDLIDSVIYIGLSNLYGGVDEYSPSSLSKVARVISTMSSLDLPVPDVSPYMMSPFTELGGWGKRRSMSEYG